MGNAASVQPDQFEKLKAEFESKKDTLSDEELFNHMKVFYENLIANSKQGAGGNENPLPAVATEST